MGGGLMPSIDAGLGRTGVDAVTAGLGSELVPWQYMPRAGPFRTRRLVGAVSRAVRVRRCGRVRSWPR